MALYKGLVAKHVRMDAVFTRNLLKFFRESDRMDYAEQLVLSMREAEERQAEPHLQQRQAEWDQQAMERATGRDQVRERLAKVERKAVGRMNAQIRIERKAMKAALHEEMEGSESVNVNVHGNENVNGSENVKKDDMRETVDEVESSAADTKKDGELKQKDKKEKRVKYTSLFSEDEDEAFIPEVSESLFKLAMERHKANSLHRKPKLGNETEEETNQETEAESKSDSRKENDKSETEDTVIENPTSPLHQLRKKQSTLK